MRRIRLSKNPVRNAQYLLLRLEVFAREGSLCSRCDKWTIMQPGFSNSGHCHHRKLRSRGGKDDGFNCVWVCLDCHDHIHHNPDEATRTGFMVPSWEDPAGWPVKRTTGRACPTPTGWVKTAMRVEQEEK